MPTHESALAPVCDLTVTIDLDRPKSEIDRARGQAAKLVAICVTAYPNSDRYKTEQAVINTVNLWAINFIDDDWQIVGLALAKHVAISKWPPSIAEIREIMCEIICADLIAPDEAWAVVARYIDADDGWNWGQAKSCADDLFPPPIMRAVDAVGYDSLWKMRRHRGGEMSSRERAGLDRVAFIKAYEPEYERERKSAMLPARLRQAIDSTKACFPSENRKHLAETHKSIEYLEARNQEHADFINSITVGSEAWIKAHRESSVSDGDTKLVEIPENCKERLINVLEHTHVKPIRSDDD